MGLRWCKSLRGPQKTRENSAHTISKSIAKLQKLIKEQEGMIERAKQSDPEHYETYQSVKDLRAKVDLAKKTIPALRDKLIGLQSSPDFVETMRDALAQAEKVASTTETDGDHLAELRDAFQELANRDRQLDEEDEAVMMQDIQRTVSSSTSKQPKTDEQVGLLSEAPPVPQSKPQTTRNFESAFDLV